MKKKLQIVSLLFLLLTSVLSAQSFTVGNFNYRVLSGTNVELTGYVTAPTGSLTIPSAVTYASVTYNVASFGDYSFYNCSGLTSVSIPNSVTSIGYFVFHNCQVLTSVSIPNSITRISDYIFSNCISLTSVSIPNSVTSIGDSAFAGCSSLTSVSIPNSVTSIGSSAFLDCTALTFASIPSSVTSIGNYAFYSCTSLTSVNVNWTTPLVIDSTVFKGVTLNTVDLTVPSGTPTLYSAATVWKDFKYPTLSTNSFSLNNNLQLYPNPAKDYLSISGLEDKENYSIYSIFGTKISAGSIAKDEKINTQNLASGTYFLKFDQGNSVKFIKE